MRSLKQRIISAVSAITLILTAFPVLPTQAENLSTNVTEPFRSDISFGLPDGSTAQSSSYRIPAMVTLDDGTIVAAADIRWNTTYDGGGLDTLVARSNDGGGSWDYTLANYLGDNGNEYNGSKSTCFIDPCLVVGADGHTVYMLVDLYPYGIALNGSGNTAPKAGTGFNGDNKLLLSDNDHESYDYYLNLNDYCIYDSEGEFTGIRVDEYFNYTYTPRVTFDLERSTEEETKPTQETTAPTEEPTDSGDETTGMGDDTIGTGEDTTGTGDDTTANVDDTTVTGDDTTGTGDDTTVTDDDTTSTGDDTAGSGNDTTGTDDSTTGGASAASDNAVIVSDDETAGSNEQSTGSSEDSSKSILGEILDELIPVVSAAELDADIAPTAVETHNLFFADSPFQVMRTGFLYLTKSTDGGATWGAPKLLNVKNDTEQVCLVGPGRGITTSDGVMVIPVYSYSGSTESQNMGFLYSADGENWYRANANFGSIWSSESAVVELENGTLRFFFRNGTSSLCYADYSFSSGWSSVQRTSICINSNTQLSAISYSKPAGDGSQVILVSCPASPSAIGSNHSGAGSRTNGRIFVFTDDGSAMTCVNTINVNDGHFMYSCLTERSDGSVAILYEDNETAWGVGGRYEMDMKVYSVSDLGVDFEAAPPEVEEPDDNTEIEPDVTSDEVQLTKVTAEPVTISRSERFIADILAFEISLETQSGTYTGPAQVSVPLPEGWNPDKTFGFVLNEDDSMTVVPGEMAGDTFQFRCPHFSTAGVFQVTAVADMQDVSVTLNVGQTSATYTVSDTGHVGNAGTHSDDNGVASYTIIHQDGAVKSTKVTFTGVKPGAASVTLNGITYTVTVNAQEKAVSKNISTSATMTLDAKADLGLTGDYSVSYEVTSGNAATVDANGNVSSGTTDGTVAITATVQKDGVTYGTVTYTVAVSAVTINDTKNIYVPVDGQATVEGLTGEIYTGLLDTSLATVVPASGNLSNDTITINGIEPGQTAVIVKDVQFNIFVVPSTENTTVKYLYIEVDKITNCDVYYSVNGSDLFKLEGTGILINQTYYGGFNISFYAAPHEGYALTEMTTTNSAGQYYTLTYTGDITNCPAWPIDANGGWKSSHGFQWGLKEKNLTEERLKEVFDAAIAKGCHGALTFTKNNSGTSSNNGNENNLNSNLTFSAEKLPELRKEIIGYKPAKTDAEDAGALNVSGYSGYYQFKDTVALEFGDTLLYRFTVTSESENVQYTDIMLNDTKIDYNASVPDGTYNEAGTWTYYAEYEITKAESDKYTNGQFVNDAHLNYTYKSQYSTGTYGGTASDTATCHINGIVSYVWVDGTPAEIVANVDGKYTLPASEVVEMLDSFTIEEYGGLTVYTDANGDTWTYSGEWGAYFYGATTLTWFNVETVLNSPSKGEYPMENARSITFYGRWLKNYSVVYKFDTEHPNVAEPSILELADGSTYTVDNTFTEGMVINEGGYTWTFQGWEDEDGKICNGQEKTINGANVTYVGKWTKSADEVSLTIEKEVDKSYAEGEKFLFQVSGGELQDLIVTVPAGGSVTIDKLKAGITYTVKELTDWSWRYEPDETEKSLKLNEDSTKNVLTFTNTLDESKWLTSEDTNANQYSINSTPKK